MLTLAISGRDWGLIYKFFEKEQVTLLFSYFESLCTTLADIRVGVVDFAILPPFSPGNRVKSV